MYPRTLWCSTVLAVNIVTLIASLHVFRCTYTIVTLCCILVFQLNVSEYSLRPHMLYEDIEAKLMTLQLYIFSILSCFQHVSWQLVVISAVVFFYVTDRKYIVRQLYTRIGILSAPCWILKTVVWGHTAWWGLLPYAAALVYYTCLQSSYQLQLSMQQKLNETHIYKATHYYIWLWIYYGFITSHYYPRVFHWDIIYFSHAIGISICIVCISMFGVKKEKEFRLTRSENQYGKIIPPALTHIQASTFWSSYVHVNDVESRFL